MRKIIFVVFLTIILLLNGFHVRAQERARIEVIKVDAGDFPAMTGFLDVYNAEGKFVSGLKSSDLRLLEDGNMLPLTGLVEQEIGLQIIVAVNPSPPMDLRDAEGRSRYEKIVENLRLWAEALPLEPRDQISLVATPGPIVVNAEASEWRNSLVSFQPDARNAVPGLQSLALALDLIEGQQETQSGMKRKNLDARINIWLVDGDEYFAHFSANSLKSIALQSGGDYFAFSGVETLPNPENYFTHLRHLYTFTYQSQLQNGGNHNLIAQTQLGELALSSEPQQFALDVQPPNPMLVSPPAQILRQAPEDDPYNTELLLPTAQTVEFLVEFPDGHPREIVRATLLLDEEAVAEITTPPFEKFEWNLSGYNLSGEHSLQIEVEDSLGLTKTSLGVPLTITVVLPPTGILAFFGRNGSLLTFGVVAVAGLFLVVILLVGGRRGIRSFATRRKAKDAARDPLTQPITPAQNYGEKRGLIPLRNWARRPRLTKSSAYLIRLKAEGYKSTGKPIPLGAEEMSFGIDPVKVTFVLDDPSVSPSHAAIRQNEEGQYLIYDQKSVAGTWVNFERVNGIGRTLVHGDIIHFGLLRYQFGLNKPPAPQKAQIRIEETTA